MRDNFHVMMGISKNLRADLKNRRFARNRGLHFTGKFEKIAVLPVIMACVLIEQTMRSTAFDSAVKKCYYTIVINARKGFRNGIFSYIVCIINFGY